MRFGGLTVLHNRARTQEKPKPMVKKNTDTAGDTEQLSLRKKIGLFDVERPAERTAWNKGIK